MRAPRLVVRALRSREHARPAMALRVIRLVVELNPLEEGFDHLDLALAAAVRLGVAWARADDLRHGRATRGRRVVFCARGIE